VRPSDIIVAATVVTFECSLISIKCYCVSSELTSSVTTLPKPAMTFPVFTPVSNHTAWRQRHRLHRTCLKVLMQQCPDQE